MTKVSKEQFFDAVNKAAQVDPMPTREYLPIRDAVKGNVVGQRSNWETQRGPRVLFGATETIFAGESSYFLA